MKFLFTIVLLTLGLCLFAGIQSDKTGLLSSFGWAGEKNAIASIDSKQLKKAIHLSAGYLTKQCTDTGKFLYRINVDPAITPKPRYNFLRHAGSIYALASYDQTYPHKITKNALNRATVFIKQSAIAPLAGRNDLLAVWSNPEITRNEKVLQAKLGGTGLGLVALLSVEKNMPGTTSIEYLRKMGHFLIFMQKRDGSFYSGDRKYHLKYIHHQSPMTYISRPVLP